MIPLNRSILRAACALVATAAVAPAVPAVAATPGTPDPATTVWEAEGSNMGICSAYLGTLGVRSDVNQIIRVNGDALGIANPGVLVRVRAQQSASKPPAQECLQRQQH